MLRMICKIAIAAGLLNYLAVVITSVIIGSDALHGAAIAGRYFLNATLVPVEVSHPLFLFCKWQAYSLLVTFPLGLLGAFTLRRPGDIAHSGG
jgi:hypothetical protein